MTTAAVWTGQAVDGENFEISYEGNQMASERTPASQGG